MLPGDLIRDILVKEVAAFCSFLESMPETKLKSFGLIPLAEEISKEPHRDSHGY